MNNKDIINKLREKGGSQAPDLLTAMEMLDEALVATEEIENHLKRTLSLLEIAKDDIKIAKSRINSYVFFTMLDDI